jgi:hypothetical protein
VTQHDPPVTLTLIYRMFVTLLSFMLPRARSDTTKKTGRSGERPKRHR